VISEIALSNFTARKEDTKITKRTKNTKGEKEKSDSNWIIIHAFFGTLPIFLFVLFSSLRGLRVLFYWGRRVEREGWG
jgi:hypothetical protein